MSAKKVGRIEGEIARLRAVLESAREKALAELGSPEDGELEPPEETTGVIKILADINQKRLERAAKE